MRPFRLMEKFGIEVEYMIVDQTSFSILPIADRLLASVAGEGASEAVNKEATWSNELVSHVIELKFTNPHGDLSGAERLFHENVLQMNTILASHHATLLPGGIHPWMDPKKETVLWPHEGNEIYKQYHKIFDCHRHGWANVQSVHLNISFQTDEEFERLHAAVRVLLPMIPALTAASPIAEGKVLPWKDGRLEYYRTNQSMTPTVAGKVIPEAVFSEKEYEQEIFAKIKKEIEPRDPEHLLNQYFLNSRGAIARFDRGSVEIRLIDTQECPKADIAFVSLIVAVLKQLVFAERSQTEVMKAWTTDELASIFLSCVKDGGDAVIENDAYRTMFGLPPGKGTAKEIWLALMATLGSENDRDVYEVYRTYGTLADRMLAVAGPAPSKAKLGELTQRLQQCLLKNQLLLP